ncbi:MAG: hypothetical protein ACLPX9_05860 [Rhodomicrobium sp.]
MLKHDFDKPASLSVAEGIAAIAKNGNLGHEQPTISIEAARAAELPAANDEPLLVMPAQQPCKRRASRVHGNGHAY